MCHDGKLTWGVYLKVKWKKKKFEGGKNIILLQKNERNTAGVKMHHVMHPKNNLPIPIFLLYISLFYYTFFYYTYLFLMQKKTFLSGPRT